MFLHTHELQVLHRGRRLSTASVAQFFLLRHESTTLPSQKHMNILTERVNERERMCALELVLKPRLDMTEQVVRSIVRGEKKAKYAKPIQGVPT